MRPAPTGTAKYGMDIDTRKAGLIWALVIATSWMPPHNTIANIVATAMSAKTVNPRRRDVGKRSINMVTAICWPRLTATAEPKSEAHTRQYRANSSVQNKGRFRR